MKSNLNSFTFCRLIQYGIYSSLFILHSSFLSAQTPGKFRIVFTDKKGSPYSITEPSAYLSTRAIARRTKYGIPISLNDLPPNPVYIHSVLTKGVQLLDRSGWLNAITISVSDTNKIAEIRRLPFVSNTKYVCKTSKGKSGFVGKYKNNREGRTHVFAPTTYNQIHQINADCLNNIGFRGKGLQIAVIDARFGAADTLSAFDSLRNRGGIIATWDFVRNCANVYDDTNNVDNHGEMVLSCMAGNLQGKILGDAMDASYYLLRTEDISSENEIEEDNWAAAAEFADSAGADVITTSLYYTTFDNSTQYYTYKDMNGRTAFASIAATIAAEKGMIVCACAGNFCRLPWHYISSPNDADSILTIGAADIYGKHASFSSAGPTSDHRIKPDVAALGVNTVVASPYGGVMMVKGTSFSTPLIAGAVASLWQANPAMNNMQIMEAVKQSSSQYSHSDSLLGYGIPDFCIANKILNDKLRTKN
jgi:subtilisin family serine protease